MARIGLFSGEKTRWVQYDQDTEVLVRYIGKRELGELTDKAQKAARLSGGSARDHFNSRLGRAAVKGWRKIGQPDHPGLIVDDQPFPFSERNLDLLMAESLEFSAYVNEMSVDAKQFFQEEEESAEVKNV